MAHDVLSCLQDAFLSLSPHREPCGRPVASSKPPIFPSLPSFSRFRLEVEEGQVVYQ